LIKFMIIAAPRSGTAWAANWLTTDATLCLHDPMFEHHYSELDALPSGKVLGIACTGLFYFTDWLNKHPARKVILHREEQAINRSLDEIGMPTLAPNVTRLLDMVDGLHVDWRTLWDDPETIYKHLLPEFFFDAERFHAIRGMNVQRRIQDIRVNRDASRRLIAEMRALGI
jgi:hypothetical protein